MKRYNLALLCAATIGILALAHAVLAQGQAQKADDLATLIQSGKTKLALEQIQAGADVNRAQPDGTSPLLWAVDRTEYEIAEALIAKKADVNATNEFGVAPLTVAARESNARLVKMLLDAGAKVDSANPDGETALMMAITGGDVSVVQLLVNAGAPIRAEADGVWRQSIYYPFQLAARHAKGTALRASIAAPEIETRKYGRVSAVDAAATLDEEHGQLALFLVNRDASEAAQTSIRLGFWPDARLADSLVVGRGDPWETSTREQPDRVVPHRNDETSIDGGLIDVTLPAASWSVIRLAVDAGR